ncbi:MAG: ABC transporter ATP-binding protein [Polyangiaceae bacterium]
MSSTGAELELKGVERHFSETAGLRGVDLTIRSGEFLCLLGPSGCGKSTLLNLIAGLDVPTSGAILVNGKRVNRPGPDRTVMFQDSALFPWMTLRQNVAFPLEIAGVSAQDTATRVERVLRLVHLWRFADSPIHALSGGMRQRGALARALVSEPGTLLMDEPFAALDAQTRDVLYPEIERVWLETKKTIVFVTHNVREAVRLGDRIVVMATRPGRIRAVIDVPLERPRDDGHPDITRITSAVMRELRDEIARVQHEEGDENWKVDSDARGGLAGRSLDPSG